MAPTLIVSDAQFLDHDPGPHHPESPARLRAIHDELAARPVDGTVTQAPRLATDAELGAVHSASHLTLLANLAGRHAELDADTVSSPASWHVARLAAGGAVEAVQAVWQGRASNAFVLARPPGHHAERGRAMGFCLLNGVAIAAEAARRLGAERVLIVDWDVHHGNGTQQIFLDRSDVLYASTHQFPFYPGTGAPEEVGQGAGRGFTVNCALPQGQSDADFGAVFADLLLPVATAFRPDLVLVSAGFDAHARDPLGDMRVTERGYAAMTTALMDVAAATAGGRMVLLLEGGYDLDALAGSTRACLEVLTGARRDDFPTGAARVRGSLSASRAALAAHWSLP